MRLVTRPDFDGLVCGALITALDEIDSYLFVEPKFMQDGLVEILKGDVITNLPYHSNCSIWFDHHITNAESWPLHLGLEARRLEGFPGSQPPSLEESLVPGKGGFRLAPSAARVVFEYYTSVFTNQKSESKIQKPEDERRLKDRLRFLNSERIRLLLEETDKIDAGLLSREDVLQPEGYVLISITINGKSSQDEPYWLKLIRLLRDASLEEVLSEKEVQRRCQQILSLQEELKDILLKRATLNGNVILVDLRGTKDLTDVNRYLLYTLFPTGNISMKVTDDVQRGDVTAISVGYNIFNTTSKVNVGALLQKYGGGGHKVVGSCRVPNAQAEQAVTEILKARKE
ncbi:MAG: hypothetical protein ACE5FB_01060 [Candidatus Binatia bacterium]